jgi:hypothetical protein
MKFHRNIKSLEGEGGCCAVASKEEDRLIKLR